MSHPNPHASLAAAIIALVLLVIGVWVINRLDASQKAMTCVERGGGKCAALGTDAPPGNGG